MAQKRASLTSIQEAVTGVNDHLDKVDDRLDKVDENLGQIDGRLSGLENFKKKIIEWGVIAGLSFTTGKATDVVDFSSIFSGPNEAEAITTTTMMMATKNKKTKKPVETVKNIVETVEIKKPLKVKKGRMRATYIKNYDADTITVDLDCNFDLACKNMGLRVLGLDTPEIKVSKSKPEKERKCEKNLALIAREFVKEELTKAKLITLENVKRGKYFRIVADVLYDGKNLKEELFKKGYAVYYDGGTKSEVDWCNKLKKHF